jgi:hypothetical protein
MHRWFARSTIAIHINVLEALLVGYESSMEFQIRQRVVRKSSLSRAKSISYVVEVSHLGPMD